jgi:transglutaminase-like putative cysteine protease
MRAVLLAVAAAGCMSYGEGSFHDGRDPFVGRRVALECVDIAVAPTQDASAQGLVLAFTFGNHCTSSISIDFSKVAAVGRYADGTRELHAYDPKHELRALRIDAGNVAREEISYLADDGSTPAATCVDVDSIESEHAPAHWLCFGEWDLGIESVSTLARPPIHAAASTTSWPLPEEIEPEVASMPADEEITITAVGTYLADRIRGNPRRLVKALHDYVVRRISYDQFSLRSAERLPQDADAVFARRTGVCEGYANLFVALGWAAGIDIREVDGYAHAEAAPGTREPVGEMHAWNVAHVDDGWVVIDATWDRDAEGHASTYYLMTPPGIFARTHVAIESDWQLVAPELTLADFVAR